ncbi:MAG: response regulator transcription factor [Candidatus Binatia bacterium]
MLAALRLSLTPPWNFDTERDRVYHRITLNAIKPIEVLLLEPDLWRYLGVVHVLQGEPTIKLLGEEDYNKILALKSPPKNLKPDILMLSHILLVDFGLRLLTTLKEPFPQVKILVHGYEAKIDRITEVIAAGARGYFLLSSLPSELRQAIDFLSKGLMWGPTETFASMAEQRTGQKANKLQVGIEELVTPQEKALLEMLAQGMANKDIASKLGVADVTIKSYLGKLYKRFGVENRQQLLSYALSHNLISNKTLQENPMSPLLRNRRP